MRKIIYILFAVFFIASCSKQEPMSPAEETGFLFSDPFNDNVDITDPDKDEDHDGDSIVDPDKDEDHDKDVKKNSKG